MAKPKKCPSLRPNKKMRYNKRQLRKGIKVEMEHTKDPAVAEKITKHHLAEGPKFNAGYYTGLSKLEKTLE